MLTNIADVADGIRRYCAAHPNARDTIEGIAWWLAMQRAAESMRRVREAVEALVDEGILERYESGSGALVYGCCPRAESKPNG